MEIFAYDALILFHKYTYMSGGHGHAEHGGDDDHHAAPSGGG